MFRERIPARQLSAWLFAAMVPVGIQLLSGSGWIWVMAGTIISLVGSAVLRNRSIEAGKTESILLFIYVVLLLGQLLYGAAQCWPMGNSDPAVPLILLLLAAWSAQKGPSAAARVGAVLFWLVLLLYIIVFAAGVPDVKIQWLVPKWNSVDGISLVVFLLPWGANALLREGEGLTGKDWLAPVFILTGMLITAGVLSPKVAAKLSNAFYEMSRSLNLWNLAQRFEALICGATAVGWFSLLSVLLTLCGVYVQKIFPGMGKGGVWLAAEVAAIWKLCGLHIKPVFLLVAGTVFWGVLPLMTQGLEKIKKS